MIDLSRNVKSALVAFWVFFLYYLLKHFLFARPMKIEFIDIVLAILIGSMTAFVAYFLSKSKK